MKLISGPLTALQNWSPEEIAVGRRWVDTWRIAGDELKAIRHDELRKLDTVRAIALLRGPGPATRVLRPTSGLVEQQRLFMRAARRE